MDIHKISTGFQPIVVVSKKNSTTKVKKEKNKIKILKTGNSPRKHYRKSKSSSDHLKRKSDPENTKVSQNINTQPTSQNNFSKRDHFRSTSISNSYTSSDPDSELHFPSPPTSQIIDSSDESVIVMSKLTKPSKILKNAHSQQKQRNCVSILLTLGATCLVIGVIERSTNLLGIVDILETHTLKKRDLNWNKDRNGISDFIARNRNPGDFARINFEDNKLRIKSLWDQKSALEQSILNVQKDQKWVGKIITDFKNVNFTQIALENIKVNEAKGPFINEVDKLVDEKKRGGEKYVKKAEIFRDNFVIRVKPKVRKNRPPPSLSLVKK